MSNLLYNFLKLITCSKQCSSTLIKCFIVSNINKLWLMIYCNLFRSSSYFCHHQFFLVFTVLFKCFSKVKWLPGSSSPYGYSRQPVLLFYFFIFSLLARVSSNNDCCGCLFNLHVLWSEWPTSLKKKILTFVIIPNFQNACKFKKSVNSLEAR